jgi:Zn-dependent protease
MSQPDPGFPPGYELRDLPGLMLLSPPRRRYWLHALLFVLTAFSTLVVGSRLQYNFLHGLPAYVNEADLFPFVWALQQPSRLLLGIPFSVTLMGILLAHEMGHYLACVRYRVYATLPFFIPAPTLIGTLGAFIRIKSPIRSRRALFDIGVAGPLAGFAVALPVLVVALRLSHPAPPNLPDSEIDFNFPLVFHLMHRLLGGGVPLANMSLHSTAVAAWVGMFATALNLLPGGQLDGGHILYALWPTAHRRITRFTIVLLIGCIAFWVGWGIWAILLTVSGMRHPPVGPAMPRLFPDAEYEDPWAPLGSGRIAVALVAALLLVLTFLLAPFPGGGLVDWQIGR